MRRLTRTRLGRKFNEGARLFWLALRERGWDQDDATDRLDLAPGHASKLLYGDQRPGRGVAEKLRKELGIDPALWDAPPLRPFVPPAAEQAA